MEGNLIFRCGLDKADWYLSRGLAAQVAENPLTIQFNFKPKGPGHQGDPYYLADKHNRCVVCGIEEDLTRHHIVPRCYRRFFPERLKRHSSYDVMILCVPCHRDYEDSAVQLKQRYADKHDIPLTGIRRGRILERDAVRHAAYTLMVHGHTMPPDRIKFFEDKILVYTGSLEITPEVLEQARKLDPTEYEDHIYHGQIVIEKEPDLDAFCKQWRYHFIGTMEPQFLPNYWSAGRNIDREERRAS
jgi:exonuclease 3'-5' domain-containing protein 2